jgi:hypothetical protein
MMVIREGGSPDDTPASVSQLPDPQRGSMSGSLDAAMDRHPSTLGRHLDVYLTAVAAALQARGVVTGSPQRSDAADRLIGSIVLDCTALRLAAWTPEDPTAVTGSPGGAVSPEHPAPEVATWDEDTGWSVGNLHDPTRSSPRYLHPDVLPVPTAVADFVVGLALGQPLGSAHPVNAPAPGRPRLRLVP